MILSKTSEYAVRILAYMVVNKHDKYNAKYLHEQLKIPYKYLTKLMTDLTKRGCVVSIQGRDGGFMLAKEPVEISLADIVEAVEGAEKFNGCILGFDDCSDENPCALHYFWEKNKDRIISMMRNTTLEDLTKVNITKF